jgi:pimeloyl-ACP methyl ester carboxylesterase
MGMPKLRVRSLVAVAAVAVMALVTMAGPGSRAAAQGVRAGSPRSGLARYYKPVKWSACAHHIPKPFQCATEPVPLDYSDPAGGSLKIAMMRLPASDPRERIGSLFVNFGGPGGPDITDLVSRAYTDFSPAIRARFDLVTWDPRGIEYSSPVNCFASAAASLRYYDSMPVFPYPQTKEPGYFAQNALLGTDCEQRDGTLLDHISSADTARDLNLLREDLGAPRISYLGFSYGTVIGAIYANLFPRHVRAMVLDGSLDFQGNAAGDHPGDSSAYPVDVRQGVARAGQDTFDRFLTLCAKAKRKCAFSAGGNLQQKWATLLARAQAGKLSYANLMLEAYYKLEDPISDWPGLAVEFQRLYTATSDTKALTPDAQAQLANVARAAAGAYSGNRADAYYSIQCADSLVPTQTSIYHNLAISEDAKVPGFGRLMVYDQMPCATWPAMHTDAYDGPWDKSRTTILVINARYDPITPIWGARAGVHELHNARLLTVDGDGHTSMYVEPSSCRDNAELAYLVSGKLPRPGTVCPVNALPFGLRPG